MTSCFASKCLFIWFCAMVLFTSAMPKAIGIDLGTTFTCVAFMKTGEIVEVVPNLNDNKLTPSVVHFGAESTKVGEDAVAMRGKDPKNTIFQAKRFMGLEADDVEIRKRYYPFEIIASNKGNANIRVTPNSIIRKSDAKVYSPEQISNEIIRYAKKIAEDCIGQKVTEAVITVPANFTNSQRQARFPATKDAGELAGLKVLRVVNEPTAAALAYGFDKKNKTDSRTVLVYDLGGGTFDVSIVRMRGTEADVKSTQGLTFLGGEDFTYRIYEEAIAEFKKKGVQIPKDEEFALYQSCDQAKKTLSSCESTVIELFDSRGQRNTITITRETFNELCEDLFEKTIDCVKEAIRDSDYDANTIDDIVLVGGSSRIPRVHELLQKLFKSKKLKFDIPPDFAVAHGAAILADSLAQSGGSIIKASGGGAVKLADITAATLGVGIIFDRVRILIPRKTRYPTSGTNFVRNMYDYQTKIKYPIVEGESAFESKNKLLGTLYIGIPPKIAGTHFTNITFTIDADGILSVQVTDKETGKEANMQFEPSKVTTAERNAMMRNRKNRDEEDMIQKAKATALTAFADAILDAKQMVHKVGSENGYSLLCIVAQEENWIKGEYPSDSDLYEHAKALRDAIKRFSMRRAFFSPPAFTYDSARIVGEGGFGQVYYGTLTDTSTPICVKVTRNASDTSFDKEFELLAKMKGKAAIIQTHGYYDGGAFRCIVLERADGSLENLLDLPRNSLGLPTETLQSLIGDLAKALNVLFELKIAHRDIKPMNILYFNDNSNANSLCGRYTFKLCDFGEGKSVQDMNNTFHTVGGTCPYMAPQVLARYLGVEQSEKMNAERLCDIPEEIELLSWCTSARSDLWSLGITLFRCATGRFPFEPTPFNARNLLNMINGRPNNLVMSHEEGKYSEELDAIIHPRWFLDAITILIRLLLYQKNLDKIAILMAELSKLNSRIVFNMKNNVFYITHPKMIKDHVWFMELETSHVVDNYNRIVVINDHKEVQFIGNKTGDRLSVQQIKNPEIVRPRDDRKRVEPHSEIIDVPGRFLIVFERQIDRTINVHSVANEETLKQIEEHLCARTAEMCAAFASYDLHMLQLYTGSVDRLSKAIQSQRKAAIDKLREALNHGSSRNAELRNFAVATFKKGISEEFSLLEHVEKANIAAQTFRKILDDQDNQRMEIRPDENTRKKQELITMIKDIFVAQRNLQHLMQINWNALLNSMRRIVEFNELAENLEADFNGRPLPHDCSFNTHPNNNNEEPVYDTPPTFAANGWSELFQNSECTVAFSVSSVRHESSTSSGYSSGDSIIKNTSLSSPKVNGKSIEEDDVYDQLRQWWPVSGTEIENPINS